MGLVLLAITVSACSKKKDGGGAAPPPPQEQKYHLENGVCYNENNERVDYDNCNDDDGDYTGGRCTGYVYYTDCDAGKGYRVDCRDSNALAVECEDPEGYAYPGEVVDCTDQSYDYNRYCR